MKDFSLSKFATKSKSFSSLFRIYRYFIYEKNKFNISLLIFIIFLTGFTPVIDSIFLKNLTDAIEFYADNNSAEGIMSLSSKWVILYLLWWESQNIMWRSYDYFYLKTAPNMRGNVVAEFYNYVQFHSHNFFQTHLAGDITNRITEAANATEMVFAYLNEKIFKKTIILFSTIIALYYVNAIVATIFLIWLSVFISISIYFSKRINFYSVRFSKEKANIAGKIVDSICNISMIRMFSAHKFERQYLGRSIDAVIVSDQRLQLFMLKLRYALGFSCTTMIGFMIYYTIFLRSNEVITTGHCVMIITLCISVIADIWDLTQEFGDLFEYIGAFNQSLSLLQEYDITESKNAQDIEIKNPNITFKNVSFNYKENYNQFDNQSIKIPAYQKVGLAGFSGSGKTTFTRMINRVYDICAGEILIDGHDIKDFSLKSLNSNISLISQEPMLFHRTIRENIAYAKPDSTDDEIIKAAKAAHIHDHIIQLPDGYETMCGERGNNLSGGQRQRISIARAFLKEAPILIIDEATSALDSRTEKLIQESLVELMKDKTVIVIAHRLSTLLNMDRILVFDKGKIAEDGTHASLLENGKIYKLLWQNY